MTDEKLIQKIIDHYKNPRNFYKLKDYSLFGEYRNPYCGDEIEVFAKIENDLITELSFQGSGCSICIAAASIMFDKLKGQNVDILKTIQESEFLAEVGVTPDSKRATCALIGFNAIKNLS
jgi:nitrogen fixation NifU-like protein